MHSNKTEDLAIQDNVRLTNPTTILKAVKANQSVNQFCDNEHIKGKLIPGVI